MGRAEGVGVGGGGKGRGGGSSRTVACESKHQSCSLPGDRVTVQRPPMQMWVTYKLNQSAYVTP